MEWIYNLMTFKTSNRTKDLEKKKIISWMRLVCVQEQWTDMN